MIRDGDATTHDTIRRTSGSTASSVGNATSQDIAHAPGQVARNAGVGPRLFSVDMTDTTNVIRMDNTSGVTTGAKRAGSFRTANMFILFGNSGGKFTSPDHEMKALRIDPDHDGLMRCLT